MAAINRELPSSCENDFMYLFMLKQQELIMNVLWQAKHSSGGWEGLRIWVKLIEAHNEKPCLCD